MTKKFLALLLAVVMVCAMGIPVSAAVADTDVAKIGDNGYATLDAAFTAVKDGETIVLLKDVELQPVLNSGSYYDGIIYVGDKSFTLDLGGKTISGASGINDYLIYLNNKGEKANEITFVNGTIAGGANLWNVIAVSGNSATFPTTLNLGTGLTVTGDGSGNNGEDGVIKVRRNSIVNVLDGAKIVSQAALYGVQAGASEATVNIYDGAVIEHNYNNAGAIAVTGTGTCNVFGGKITSANVAVQPSSSGTPAITISGGEIKAPTAVVSGSDWNNYPDASSSITISGGKLEGDVIAQAWGTTDSNSASISITITGGELKDDIIVNANCSADISGGTVASVTVASSAEATISGGTVKGDLNAAAGDLTVTGGTFEKESVQNNVQNYAPTGSTVVGGEVLLPMYATFKADGNTIATVTYYKNQTAITEPAVPAKEGYYGYWAAYELNGDITVNAKYVKIVDRSRVSFVADGRLVGIILYRANQDELTVLPKVPAKEGYVGTWAEYTLTGKNMIVRAVYTPIAE